jgi:hypothetical protein
MTYIYFIDGQKFITNNHDEIPHYEFSSPNENTPALEYIEIGFKLWCEKGHIRHRLTGPARIWNTGDYDFWLNDIPYINVREWINNHPNPDLYFDAIGLNETERVLWFLKN